MENSEYFGRASVRNLVSRFENQSDGTPRTNLVKFKSKSSSSIARPRAPLLSFADEIPITQNNFNRGSTSPTVSTFKERRALFERPGAALPLRRTNSTNLECLQLQEINEISKKADEIVFKVKKFQQVGSGAYIAYLNQIVELLIQVGGIDTFGNASVQQEKLATLQVLQKCYFQLKDKIQTILDDGSNELEETELLQIKDLINKWEQITEKKPSETYLSSEKPSETYLSSDKPPPPPTTPKPVQIITNIHYEEHPVLTYVPPNVKPKSRPAVEIKPVKAESIEDDSSYKTPKVKELMGVFQSPNSEEKTSSSKESSPSPSRDIKDQPPLSPYKYVSYAELKKQQSVNEDNLKVQPVLQVSSYVGLLNSFSPKIEDDEKPPAYEEAIRDPKIEEILQIKIQEIQGDIEAEMPNKSTIQIEEYEDKQDDDLDKKEETISIIITKAEEQQDQNSLINETEADDEGSENLYVPNELITSYQKAVENELIPTNSENEIKLTPDFESYQTKAETEPIPNKSRIKYEELSSADPNALQELNQVRVTNSVIAAYDQLLEENEPKNIKNEPKQEDFTIPKDNVEIGEGSREKSKLQDDNEIETNDENIRDAKIESYELIQAERAFYSTEEVFDKDVTNDRLEVHVPISYFRIADDEPKDDAPIWTAEEPQKLESTNPFLINLPQEEQVTTNEDVLASDTENIINQKDIFIVRSEPPKNEIHEAENNLNFDEYNDLKDRNSTIETHDQLSAENSKNEENPIEILDAEITPKNDNEEVEEGQELIILSKGSRNRGPEVTPIKHLEEEDIYKIIKNEEDIFIPNKRAVEVDEEARDDKIETEGQTDVHVAEPGDAKIESYEFIQAEKAFSSAEQAVDKHIVKIGQLEVHVPISYLLVADDVPSEDIPENSVWTADEPSKEELINLLQPENHQEESFIVINPDRRSPQDNSNMDNSYLDEHNLRSTNPIIKSHHEQLEQNNLIDVKTEDEPNRDLACVKNEIQYKDDKQNNEEEEFIFTNEAPPSKQNNNETEGNEEETQENGSISNKGTNKIDVETSEKTDNKEEIQDDAGGNLEIQEINNLQNNKEVETRTHTVTTNITVVSSRKGDSDSIIASYDQLLEDNGLKPLENSNVNETVVQKVVTERVVLRKQESVKSLTGEQNNFAVLDEYPSLCNNLSVTNSIIAAYDQLLQENNLRGSIEESIKSSTNEEVEAKGEERNEDLKSEELDLLKRDNDIEDDVFRPSENIADRKENLIEGLQKPVEEEVPKDETKLPQTKEEQKETATENLQELSGEPSRTKIGVTESDADEILIEGLQTPDEGETQKGETKLPHKEETTTPETSQENVELSGEPSRTKRGVTDSIIASYDLLLDEHGLNQEDVLIKNIQKETVVMRRHQRSAELIGIESFDPFSSKQEEYPSLYNNVTVTNSIIEAYDQLLEDNNLKSIRHQETLKPAKQTEELAENEGASQKLFNLKTQVTEESDEDQIRSKTSEEKPLLQSTPK